MHLLLILPPTITSLETVSEDLEALPPLEVYSVLSKFVLVMILHHLKYSYYNFYQDCVYNLLVIQFVGTICSVGTKLDSP